MHLFKLGPHRFLLLSCLWLQCGTGWVKAQNTVGVTDRHQSGQQASGEHTVADLLKSLQLRPGYTTQAIATEPLIADPVTARLDLEGRLWVVEMPDYPVGPGDGEAPSGRIKILDDTDHDGIFDRSTVFAKGLLFATGVQPF